MHYRVGFSEYFLGELEKFITSMEDYYIDFYSDTGIIDIDLIVKNYIDTYKSLKGEIFLELKNLGESGLLGRHVIRQEGDHDICFVSFQKRSYNITAYAILNKKEKSVIIYDFKINTK